MKGIGVGRPDWEPMHNCGPNPHSNRKMKSRYSTSMKKDEGGL